MKKRIICVVVFFAFAKALFSQQTSGPYLFTDIIDLEATLESEITRMTGKTIDLSEMYTVRNTYPTKAENYVMRQGKAQFSEGGLAHDVINSVAQYGIVPLEAYTGLAPTENRHSHAEMVAVVKAMLDAYVDNPGRSLSKKWQPAVAGVLDLYLGENLEKFNYQGKSYTPQSFAQSLKINAEDYVTLTSYSHQDFYSNFILNIPDNFSNGSFYNLPLEEFVSNLDNALNKGFTVTLDCDVSEASFSSKHGVAVIPANAENTKVAVLGPEPEKTITQQYRQDQFENYNTTDDHLMHITGKATDQNGTIYYKVKNSWGTDTSRTKYDGYVYMSAAYIRLKSISILMHKDAVLSSTKKKLKL